MNQIDPGSIFALLDIDLASRLVPSLQNGCESLVRPKLISSDQRSIEIRSSVSTGASAV